MSHPISWMALTDRTAHVEGTHLGSPSANLSINAIDNVHFGSSPTHHECDPSPPPSPVATAAMCNACASFDTQVSLSLTRQNGEGCPWSCPLPARSMTGRPRRFEPSAWEGAAHHALASAWWPRDQEVKTGSNNECERGSQVKCPEMCCDGNPMQLNI